MLAGRRRKVVAGVVVVVVAWMGVAAWLLRDAGHHVEAGRRVLDEAREGATPASLLDPATEAELTEADHHFDAARDRLRHPFVAPLRVVPVVGRHVRAADAVVATAHDATAVAAEGVADLRVLADRPVETGPQRVARLDELADLMGRTDAGLAELDPGDPDALITPLSEAIADLRQQRDDNRRTLARAESATRTLADVLRGPETFLLLGANNGEMRAGSGMFLSATTIRFRDGHVALDDVRPTQELVLPAGTVAAGSMLATNWPWLDPARDFRNLALSADFPQSAELAAAMWEAVPGGEPVAGVIAVDVDALRGLLRVVGPVEVDGVRYTADTVRGELLREQYERYGDDRDERRDRLGEVARAVFDRFEAGDWELDAMATAITEAVQGRHLLVWSADAAHQDAWAAVGAGGRLTEDSVAVSLLNRGANKLDSYVDTDLTIEAEPFEGGATRLVLRYRITNDAPDGGPRYVVGPNVDGLAEGEYRGIVVVNLPGAAQRPTIDGVRQTLVGLDGGPTVVLAGEVSLPRGTTAEVVVEAVLPRGMRQVTLEASARIPRTRLHLGDREPEVDRRRTVVLADLAAPSEG